jgi:murein DD-endopeptidase MepM/ murein hydrolase activator NlpD
MRALLLLLCLPSLALADADAWLTTDGPVADGFDFPVGDADGGGSYTDAAGRTHTGWYVATSYGEVYALGIHPGEDWNGRGGGDTDRGQPVRSTAAGVVISAAFEGQPWGGVVEVEHMYYDSAGKHRIRSLYAHLDTIDVQPGDVVQRRQRVGTIGSDPDRTFKAHLHFELRTDPTLPTTFWPSSHAWDRPRIDAAYADPRAFLAKHRTTFVPQAEPLLIVLDPATDTMTWVERGEAKATYSVAWGQLPGPKRREGDLRTPRGLYFVVSKARGEFGGTYGAYYGGHWIKVNYPGPHDAERGLAEGWIDEAKAEQIRTRWAARKLTPQDTELGSGIGLHGWANEWSDDESRGKSFGCVVLHNRDIAALYDRIPEGTAVVILD